MSFGTLSRAELRSVLSSVFTEAISGAQEVPQIKLDAAPQGIAHRGFSLEEFRSRDNTSRNRRGTSMQKVYSLTMRYAYRLTGDIEKDRIEIDSDVD